MKKYFTALLAGVWIVILPAVASLSRQVVDYRIEARLQPDEKLINGRTILTWRNLTEQPAPDLHFHLYLNAFMNNRSTFMKESGGSHRGFSADDTDWGYEEITSLHTGGGIDLMPGMVFIQPDDDNPDDRTVLRVPLEKPVPPGGEITLEMEFRSKLPTVFARSGYKDDFFMVAQWFPKLGVWEEGAWNCHQYHAESEFYADFGVFEVEITAPQAFLVGATGERTAKSDNGDGTVTYTHYQEDVHDFAWTACPDFVEFRERFRLADIGVDTELILLVHRHHLNLKDRFLTSLKQGVEFYSREYGPYPYATVTLVDPPLNALGAGGMEYPTLFTTMGMSFLPEGILVPEMVTIHEFGHGYWYGIVASNEFEEPWLDEGINSYSEARALDHYYGKDRSMINWRGIHIGDTVFHRIQTAAYPRRDPILRRSWEFYSGGSYGVNSYQKAAITLRTLENHLGENVMRRVMRTYYERWKFRHPKTEDFIAAAEEASGRDLDWFFNQFLSSDGMLDYAVTRVDSREIRPRAGRFEGRLISPEESGEKAPDSEGGEKLYRNEVAVVREGDHYFPQEILITFEDGEEIREFWDGKDRWKLFEYERTGRLKSAVIDPERKILLDVNMTNNSRLREPPKTFSFKHALRTLLGLQHVLGWISF